MFKTPFFFVLNVAFHTFTHIFFGAIYVPLWQPYTVLLGLGKCGSGFLQKVELDFKP
jgi:hypothetical protein